MFDFILELEKLENSFVRSGYYKSNLFIITHSKFYNDVLSEIVDDKDFIGLYLNNHKYRIIIDDEYCEYQQTKANEYTTDVYFVFSSNSDNMIIEGFEKEMGEIPSIEAEDLGEYYLLLFYRKMKKKLMFVDQIDVTFYHDGIIDVQTMNSIFMPKQETFENLKEASENYD